jgi:hypothetical protein
LLTPQIGEDGQLPPFCPPNPKETYIKEQLAKGKKEKDLKIIPIPRPIRPTVCKYRMEVKYNFPVIGMNFILAGSNLTSMENTRSCNWFLIKFHFGCVTDCDQIQRSYLSHSFGCWTAEFVTTDKLEV